jgi:tRNA(fMet)-specific endonuclease VapC
MPVLDTTFLVDLLRKRRAAYRKLLELEEKGVFLATTAMNVLEIYRGAYLSSDVERNLSLIGSILEDLPVLPLTDEVYRYSARSLHNLPGRESLQAISMRSLQPSRSCYDGVIVTRDAHYSKIPGIVVEEY